MPHSARATATLQALIECDPALAALALWCRHHDCDSVDRVETVGSDIRYGPDFSKLPSHQQIGLAGHHILHVALQHPARMQAMAARLGPDFAPDLWQIACDAIVNETILAAGHALPRPALTLSGLMTSLGAQDQSEGLLSAWDAERLYHRLQTADGADAQGTVRNYAKAQAFHPDLSAGPSAMADDDASADASDWRAHLARALAAGRAAGVGLGAVGLRLADLPQPFVPWELVLRRLLVQVTLPRQTPSPARPSRRWLAQAGAALERGADLPPWQPRLQTQGHQPSLLIALDASGSIPQETLRRFMAEAGGISRRMRATCTLLVFDEDIRAELPLNPGDWRATLSRLELPEGGGTDFRPVFARAAALAPSALIVLGDMHGSMPHTRPRFPVVWACPAADPPGAPFGRVLSLAR